MRAQALRNDALVAGHYLGLIGKLLVWGPVALWILAARKLQDYPW